MNPFGPDGGSLATTRSIHSPKMQIDTGVPGASPPKRQRPPAADWQITTFSGRTSPAQRKSSRRGTHVTGHQRPRRQHGRHAVLDPGEWDHLEQRRGRPAVPGGMPAAEGWPGHCLGISLSGSMNGLRTVTPWWRPVGVSTSNSWPSGSASPIGSIA